MEAFIGILAGGLGAYMISSNAASMASSQAQATAQRMQLEASRQLDRRTFEVK